MYKQVSVNQTKALEGERGGLGRRGGDCSDIKITVLEKNMASGTAHQNY